MNCFITSTCHAYHASNYEPYLFVQFFSLLDANDEPIQTSWGVASDQNGTEQADPTENGVQNVEMPLAFSAVPEPDSDGVAQGVDASADDNKMEEWIL
jgi:hypothetical protein